MHKVCRTLMQLNGGFRSIKDLKDLENGGRSVFL